MEARTMADKRHDTFGARDATKSALEPAARRAAAFGVSAEPKRAGRPRGPHLGRSTEGSGFGAATEVMRPRRTAARSARGTAFQALLAGLMFALCAGLLSPEPARAQTAGICDRTPEVRDAIVAAINNVTDCADVTAAHLAALTEVDIRNNATLTTLQAGDFLGLTGLTSLVLIDTALTSLPANVFDNLTALTTLEPDTNSLTELPANVFDKLTAVTPSRVHLAEGNRHRDHSQHRPMPRAWFTRFAGRTVGTHVVDALSGRLGAGGGSHVMVGEVKLPAPMRPEPQPRMTRFMAHSPYAPVRDAVQEFPQPAPPMGIATARTGHSARMRLRERAGPGSAA